jgi:hypothetical protein
MRQGLDATSRKVDAKINEILDTAQAGELSRARDAGVLDLDPLGTQMGSTLVGSIEAAALGPSGQFAEPAQALVDLIERILGPDAATYPMFSELPGGLASAMVREGKIGGAELAPATQAGIAGRFIAAIDAFPDAPMDVVLDARGKLRGPLRRFRAGVTRLSRQLDESGITALDSRFERASADLYREHVAPALEEIEALSREMGLRNALLWTSPTVARDVALATMALAMTTGGGVEQLATLATGATADLVSNRAEATRAARAAR